MVTVISTVQAPTMVKQSKGHSESLGDLKVGEVMAVTDSCSKIQNIQSWLNNKI